MSDTLDNLPGEEFIRQGLSDLQQGHLTIPACLAEIARRPLSQANLISPFSTVLFQEDIEVILYRLLREQGGDAYSQYNAWLRRLVSFERALIQRLVSKST